MKFSQQQNLSKHIFRLLKVSEITYPIGRTVKGNLGIAFNENSEDFVIMLDSIPLSTESIMEDENNMELKKILQKYLFDSEGPILKYPAQGFTREELFNEDGTVKGPITPMSESVSPEKPEKPVKQKKNGNLKAKKSS